MKKIVKKITKKDLKKLPKTVKSYLILKDKKKKKMLKVVKNC